MVKMYIALGSILAFLGVALGAFGAHALKSRLSESMFRIFETGVQYHMIHALALIFVGIIAHWLNYSQLLNWSGRLFAIGILIFSGSLYVLSISGIKSFGAITPFGGLAFLAGWILLAITAFKHL